MKLITATLFLATLPLVPAHPRTFRLQPVSSIEAVRKSAPDTGLRRPNFPAVGSQANPLAADHWLNTPNWIDSAHSPHLKFGDGHVYILNFTAMWCGSCPALYPVVADAFKKYEAQGLRVVFVTGVFGLAEDHMTTFDSAAPELAELPGYFTRHEVTAPIAIYENANRMQQDYGDEAPPKISIALPKVVVIDGSGVVREVLTGWNKDATEQQLSATLATLLPPKK